MLRDREVINNKLSFLTLWRLNAIYVHHTVTKLSRKNT